jgi:hypothetical protein
MTPPAEVVFLPVPARLSLRRPALPRALAAIEHLGTWGPTVIVSDGDVVLVLGAALVLEGASWSVAAHELLPQIRARGVCRTARARSEAARPGMEPAVQLRR